MVSSEAFGLLFGAMALGAIHGIEPGHGWPVAASYALEQSNAWIYGFAASLTIGVGHLVSSIAMVLVFFFAKSYFSLTQINEPIIVTSVRVGGPVSIVAGIVLIALGIREYRHGHSHGTRRSHGETHEHSRSNGRDHDRDQEPARATHSGCVSESSGDHCGDALTPNAVDANDPDVDHPVTDTTNPVGHPEDHARNHHHDDLPSGHDGHAHDHHHEPDDSGGLRSRVMPYVPFVGGTDHPHSQADFDEATDRGMLGIAWFAFLLGFAHEEEFEIIAMCAGSTYCLELMSVYAVTVIVCIIGLTMLLIAGYQHFQQRVERYAQYLPTFSAAVLVGMGLGFVIGLF